MNRKIRILLLVSEPWRCDDGGGNTLNNFFEGMDAEFAQVYCSARSPVNSVCFKYFQMTDGMAILSFLTRKPCGHVLSQNRCEKDLSKKLNYTERIVSRIKKVKLNIFLLLKEIVWRYSNWKTDELREFILEFNPDIIYAPCYASPFMLALTRWIKEFSGRKVITWSADDNYSLRQFSFSISYWLKRFWVRNCLRRTYPYYDVFYSASEDEAVELEKIVNKKIKILRKCVSDSLIFKEKNVVFPIQLVYAGGLYLNRWKILAKIKQAVANINKDGIKCILNIYTQSDLSPKMINLLHDGYNSYCYQAVDFNALQLIYQESDIALHVESQELKYKYITRLSFSTKIIDCLSSGCAIIAIAWDEQTGFKYLKENNAAICISNEDDIEKYLRMIVNDKTVIKKYAKAAYNLAITHHKRSLIQSELYNTMCSLID